MLAFLTDKLLSVSFFSGMTLIFFVFLYVFFHCFETLLPAQKGQTMKAFLENIAITSVYVFFGTLSVVAISSTFASMTPKFLPAEFSADIVPALPLVLLYMLLNDLIFYWYHRAEHAFPFLWAIHELHHSDTSLNVTTGYRSHWLEQPLQFLLITTPLYFVFHLTPGAFLFTFLFLTVWEFFTHANLRLHLSVFTPIVCGPQVHRIHHSILPEHRDKNFAQFFPFLDILFGSYYAPKRNEFPPTGTGNLKSQVSLAVAFARPFTEWYRTMTKRRKI